MASGGAEGSRQVGRGGRGARRGAGSVARGGALQTMCPQGHLTSIGQNNFLKSSTS